jgi:cardiolipin synthase (CMP-forming)
VTIPNLVSLARIALVPVMLWLLLVSDRPAAAGWLFAFIGASDWVDGYLARRLDQVSALGKILDPVADRLAVAAAVVGGWISGALPWPVAAAIVGREGLVAVGALLLAWRIRVAVEVRPVGKAATFGVYAGVAAFLIHAGWDTAFFAWAAWLAVVPGLVLYYAAAVLYVGDARRALRAGSGVPSEPAPTGEDR